jgi:sulfur-carrier protein
MEMNMRVKVKLFATLTRFMSGVKAGRPFEVDLTEGATLKDLIEFLHIPPEETHILFINNIIQESTAELSDGDNVGIFPPVGGG